MIGEVWDTLLREARWAWQNESDFPAVLSCWFCTTDSLALHCHHGAASIVSGSCLPTILPASWVTATCSFYDEPWVLFLAFFEPRERWISLVPKQTISSPRGETMIWSYFLIGVLCFQISVQSKCVLGQWASTSSGICWVLQLILSLLSHDSDASGMVQSSQSPAAPVPVHGRVEPTL